MSEKKIQNGFDHFTRLLDKNKCENLVVNSAKVINPDFYNISKHPEWVLEGINSTGCDMMPDDRNFFYFMSTFFSYKKQFDIESGNKRTFYGFTPAINF